MMSFYSYDQNPSRFAFFGKLGRLLLIPRWDRISRYKFERKNEKDFGRSSKITPSCK